MACPSFPGCSTECIYCTTFGALFKSGGNTPAAQELPNERAQRDQVEIARGQQALLRRAGRGQRHRARNRPRNERRKHDDGVFQVDGARRAVRLRIGAELVREQDGKRLVAGDHGRSDSRAKHGAEGRDAPAHARNACLGRAEQAGGLKDAGIGRRDAHNGRDPQHGHDAAAVEQRAGGRIRCGIAGEHAAQHVRQWLVLHRQAQRERRRDARAHDPADVHMQRREHEDEHRRQQGKPVQRTHARKQRAHVLRRPAAVHHGAEHGIDRARERKRHKGRAHHGTQVVVNIRVRELADEQRARGHGRAAVAKKDARQDRAAGQHRRHAHGGRRRHAHGAHRGRRAEGRAHERGHGAREQKRRDDERARVDEIDRIADQQRHRAARAPERREHADEQKDDEDIFGRPDARPEHAADRAQAIPLPQRPAHEQHQPTNSTSPTSSAATIGQPSATHTSSSRQKRHKTIITTSESK